MAVSYHQTGNAAGCGSIAACSGATVCGSPVPRTAAFGGSSGGALSTGGADWDAGVTRAFWFVEIIPDANTNWAAGTWTVRLNVTTAVAATLTAIYICRISSVCANLATIGSATGLSISLNATGVKTQTVSGAAQTPGAGDHVYIVFVGSSAAMNAVVGITSDQDIDSPFILNRRGQVSWAELEVPDIPRRGQVSFAEMEIPDPPRRGQISWAEFETPDPPANRRGQVSWAEIEIPDEPRRGQMSFAEFEVPDAPRRGQISWSELEVPDAPRRGQLSWAEFEVPDFDKRGQISWIEFEVPDPPTNDRRGQVSWVEVEVPDEPRRGQLSWIEFEVPGVDRRGQISWTELEVPDAPRRGQISWVEMEIPELTPSRRGQISWVEMEIPSPRPQTFMYARRRGIHISLEGE